MLASHVSSSSLDCRLRVYISTGLSLTLYCFRARTSSCDVRSVDEDTSRSHVFG